MSCSVCGRASRGFGWGKASAREPILLRACSMRCLDIISTRKGRMYKLNHFEDQALDAASEKAGVFLDDLGKSDLATLSPDEWRELLATVFVAATAKIQRLTEEDAVPF